MRIWVLGDGAPARKCIEFLKRDGADVWQTTDNINGTTNVPFLPDIIASIYYKHIIRKPIIDLVNGRIFNAHTSLLPRHRGRSPVPWAIIDGDKTTGVTFHYIDEGIDTGDILLQASVQIADNETQKTLFDKLNAVVIDYFPLAFNLVKCRTPGVVQRGTSNYNRAGCPHNGEISDDWPIGRIERFIRAMIYPPLPCATYNGVEIRTMEDYHNARFQRKESARYHHISV